MSGFVALPRAVLDIDAPDAWFPGDGVTATVYAHLVNMARWSPEPSAPLPRQKVRLEQGQLVLSQNDLVRRTGLSRKTIRRAMGGLEKGQLVGQVAGPLGTIVTVIDYKRLFIECGDTGPASGPTTGQVRANQGPYQDKETKRQRDKEETLTSLSSDETPALRLVVTKAPADHLQLAEIWNTHRGGLPAVTKVTKKRRDQMRKRWTEEPSPEYWVGAVQKLARSSFANSSTWCSFDWLIKNDENHTKAAAGNYDDRAKDGEDSPSAREEERRRSIERLIAQGHDPFMGASK